MNARLVLPLLAVASLFLASCGPECRGIACGACAPPVMLTFADDVTGAALTGATIDHPDGRCDDSGTRTNCYIDSFGGGSYHFVASAPGYDGKNVELTVPEDDAPGCCSCGYLPQSVEVRLTPQ